VTRAGAAALLTLSALVLRPAPLLSGELTLHGFALGRGIAVEGPRSWLEGGWGRLIDGPAEGTGSAQIARGEAQALVEWRPAPVWMLRVHGVGHLDPSGRRGRTAGVTEAFLQFRPELTPTTTLRFRLGALFPPVSRENTAPLWSSPYTLTLSALDTWIAEEVRPTALEASWIRKSPASASELQLTASAVAGMDAAGALLAWRGWTLGDRLSVLGETLPLPPLVTLSPGGAFGTQKAGTSATAELDHWPGWLALARWSRGERTGVQVWALDNEGDRQLHRGEYAWRTRMVAAGVTLTPLPHFTLIGDGALGQTGMGPLDHAHVDVDFRAACALATLGGPRARLSVRYDLFRNLDRDHTAEDDSDDGHAWTLAALWSPARWLRLGVEALRITSTRAAAAEPANGSRRLQGEARVRF